MSKVGNSREGLSEGRENLSREKPVRERRWQKKSTKKDDQIPGQYSFIARGTELVVDNTAQLEYEGRLRKSIIKYYEEYLNVLNRYGIYNKFYGPWCSLISDNPSKSARTFLYYHMNNDMAALEDRLQKANYWMKVAVKRWQEASRAAGVSDAKLDDAYRDAKRRTAFRGYIKREITKVRAEKTLEVFSPKDLEARYQMNRARRNKNKGSE